MDFSMSEATLCKVLLVDDILPHQPYRQWVLSVPYPLRFLFASQPLDFISKLAALVPLPKMNLIRFIGVFAPNSKHREEIIIHKKIKNLPQSIN